MPFKILLSGVNAASAGLRTTAHNIANVDTTGFRASRTEFSDVLPPGGGVRVSRISEQQSQGLQQVGGTADASNVDLTDQLINMIRYSRQIEAQVNAMRTTIVTEESVADFLTNR